MKKYNIFFLIVFVIMQLQFVTFSQQKRYSEILPELQFKDTQFDLILDGIISCLHKCNMWSKDVNLVIRIVEKDSISYLKISKVNNVYSIFDHFPKKALGYLNFRSIVVFIICDTLPPYLLRTDRSKRFKAKLDFKNPYIEDPPVWIYSFVEGKPNLFNIINKCPDC